MKYLRRSRRIKRKKTNYVQKQVLIHLNDLSFWLKDFERCAAVPRQHIFPNTVAIVSEETYIYFKDGITYVVRGSHRKISAAIAKQIREGQK